MARRIFKLAVGLILILASVTPLLELADHWDKGEVPATDTELRVTAAFSCAGLLLTVAMLMRWAPELARAARRSFEALAPRQPWRQASTEPSEPTGSPPPLPLRI